MNASDAVASEFAQDDWNLYIHAAWICRESKVKESQVSWSILSTVYKPFNVFTSLLLLSDDPRNLKPPKDEKAEAPSTSATESWLQKSLWSWHCAPLSESCHLAELTKGSNVEMPQRWDATKWAVVSCVWLWCTQLPLSNTRNIKKHFTKRVVAFWPSQPFKAVWKRQNRPNLSADCTANFSWEIQSLRTHSKFSCFRLGWVCLELEKQQQTEVDLGHSQPDALDVYEDMAGDGQWRILPEQVILLICSADAVL